MIKELSDRLDLPPQELYLLGILFLVSAGMLVVSFTYGRTAALFPQLTAGIIIIGVILITIHRWLPASVQSIVAGEGGAFERDEFKDVDPEGIETDTEAALVTWRDDTVFTGILFSGYVIIGYLIGLLWATPIFVYTYARWFEQPRWIRWTLVIVSVLIAFIFQIFLGLDLMTGYIHDVVGIT